MALADAIALYMQRYPEESDTCGRFLDFVRREPGCFLRSTREGHVTGSAWVVDARGSHTLLTHHRKLDKWLQLGGHADGDHDIVRVALTEAREESGITDVRLLHPEIFDLDIHVIPARLSDPEHLHFDVRYVVLAGHADHVVGQESFNLEWVPVDRLTDFTNEESMLRMARKWNVLSAQYA
ncbi:MAG TPA: NUDIX hydrolase [Bacteroidetes bacterium]|nr:NUDIX hydrolase [Bacteroidota bacterium]